MTRRGIAWLIGGLSAGLIAIAAAVVWVNLQLEDGIADPQDSSMFDLARELSTIPGVDDAGLLYPTDGGSGRSHQDASVLLEIHQGGPEDPAVRAAIEEATCRVWRGIFFEPAFIWAAVVRSSTDVDGPDGIAGSEYLKPYGILDPVDTSALAEELGADRYEDGYLKWTPAALSEQCGPWVDPYLEP